MTDSAPQDAPIAADWTWTAEAEAAWNLAHEPAKCGHARANYKDPKWGTPEYDGDEKCEFCVALRESGAQVTALRTLLEPFAKFAQENDAHSASKPIGNFARLGIDFGIHEGHGANLGDCRAAVVALYAAPPAVPDTEPHCFDCGRKYIDGGFQDLILPNDVWRQISPTNDEGGLLCPSCICKRASDAGIKTTAIFKSGPFAAQDTTAIVEAVRNAVIKLSSDRPAWTAKNEVLEDLARVLAAHDQAQEAAGREALKDG